MEPVRVIYIMGYGHSGSTILSALLGEADDVEAVGELANLARPGWRENKRCACGTPVRDCVFWEAVVRKWQTVTRRADLAAMATRHGRFGKWGAARASHRRSADPESSFADYAGSVGALYRSIAEVAGRRVIVDASKSVSRAWSLVRIPGLDLRVIHLVRDGRAVAWSMLRKKKKTPLLRSTVLWRFNNLVANRLRTALPENRRCLVRYEDLVFRTEETLRRIESCVDVDLRRAMGGVARSEPIRFRHEVAGNRVRRKRDVVLKPDVAWTHDMPHHWQRIAWLLNRKMLREYGYEPRPWLGATVTVTS